MKGGNTINKLVKCTSIDVIKSGERLNDIIGKNQCTIRELQKILNLSCPQPIYRWMKGKILPSVDNLYMLSRVFEMHMEDMIVARRTESTEKQQLIETTVKLIDILVNSYEI